MKRFFDFEAKFGWSELIALVAVIVAVVPHFVADPLKEVMAKRPRPHVTQAELKDTKHASGDKAFHVAVRNVGEYPIEGLQFAFDVNVQREVDCIADCAARGEARFVTLGVLVFFSTGEGDAWMLDTEDALASCLMQEGERRDTPIKGETGRGVSVAWESEFFIEGGCFFTRSADGKLTAWPGYPAEDIRQAILRAGNLRA